MKLESYIFSDQFFLHPHTHFASYTFKVKGMQKILPYFKASQPQKYWFFSSNITHPILFNIEHLKMVNLKQKYSLIFSTYTYRIYESGRIKGIPAMLIFSIGYIQWLRYQMYPSFSKMIAWDLHEIWLFLVGQELCRDLYINPWWTLLKINFKRKPSE